MNWSQASSELDKQASPRDLWSLAVDTFESAGFGVVIYLSSNSDRSDVELHTNLPELYNGFDPADDPFLEYCCHSYEITRTGAEYLKHYDYLPAHARAFIERIAERGFISGYGIPVRLEGARNFGGFIIGTTRPANEFEKLHDSDIDAIKAFCLLLHRRMEELTSTSFDALSGLSPRERDVVSHVIEGATRKEVARILEISPNTVAEYTKSAYRKLGVRNKVEAARKLIR